MPIVSTVGSVPAAARGANRALEPWYGELPEQAAGVVGGAFRLLDTPGRYVRSGVNYATGGGWNPETSGWDLLERMTGVKNKPGFFGQWAGGYDLLAFAIEVGLDPLTFLGGLGAGAKAAKAGAMVGKLEMQAVAKGALYSAAKKEMKGLAGDYHKLKRLGQRRPTAADFYVRPKKTTVTGQVEDVPFGPLDPRIEQEALERAGRKAVKAEKEGRHVKGDAPVSQETLDFEKAQLSGRAKDLRDMGDDIARDLANAVEQRRMLEASGNLAVLRTEAPSLAAVKHGIGGTGDTLYKSIDGKMVGDNWRAIVEHNVAGGKGTKHFSRSEILSLTEEEALESGVKKISGGIPEIAQAGEEGVYKGGFRQIFKEIDESKMGDLYAKAGLREEGFEGVGAYRMARETGKLKEAEGFLEKIPLMGRFFRGQLGREAWITEKIGSGEILRPHAMLSLGLPKLYLPTVNTPGRILSHIGGLMPFSPGVRKAARNFLNMTEELRVPFWENPSLQVNLFKMLDHLDPMITKIPIIRDMFPGKIGSQIENALFRALGAMTYPMRATIYKIGGKQGIELIKKLLSTATGPGAKYLRALKHASDNMASQGVMRTERFHQQLLLELGGMDEIVTGIAKRVGQMGDKHAEDALMNAVHKAIKEGKDARPLIQDAVTKGSIKLTKKEIEKISRMELEDLVVLLEGTYGDQPLRAQVRNPHTGMVEEYTEKLTVHERLEELMAKASKERGVPITHVEQLGPKVTALYERLTNDLDGFGPETRGWARKMRNYLTHMSKAELMSGARPE